jgi:hypothetical protein
MSDTLSTGGDQHSPAKEEGKQSRKDGGKRSGLAAALEVKFEGGDVSPDKILVPDLALVIRAVQRLAAGQILDDSAPLPEEEKLRLVGVRRGSARYALAGPSRTVAGANLRILGDVIQHPERIGENDYVLHPVRALSHAAAKLECKISIREPGAGGVVLARIGPETYADLSKSILIAGQTEFGGKVERVGGATRSRCGLRVAFQKRMLICRVPDPAVARTLGENLYKRVVVSGEAAWIRTTWRVYAFRVEAVRPLKEDSLFDKIRAIRQAGGSDWDRIRDVRAYLDLEAPAAEQGKDSPGRRTRPLDYVRDSDVADDERKEDH